MSDTTSIAPHRGFSTKARELLLDKDELSPEHIFKSKERKKQLFMRSDSQATTSSKSSTQSIPDPLALDTIDSVAKRKAKVHKSLAELGKTHSLLDIKQTTTDRRLEKTFQEDNILRLPSADSDLSDYCTSTASSTLPKQSKRAAMYQLEESSSTG